MSQETCRHDGCDRELSGGVSRRCGVTGFPTDWKPCGGTLSWQR
ncbi:hypothetical protein [Komagataeibacter sp. FXV3]|nr:hypothetical protein [Komagataeibacter sp. FXV3]